VSTRRLVLIVVLLVLLVAATGLAVGVVLADGVWESLWLNLLTEAAGAAFIVLFVDQLFERSRRHDQDQRRRAAIEDLRFVLVELRSWLVRLFLESETGRASYRKDHDPARVPVEAFLDGLPRYLSRIDFAAPGSYKRDRYFVEWARRSFDTTVLELARWEQNFAGSAGLFDQDFRQGAERIHSFVRAFSSFLEGMERYVVRERPASPVLAYDGVTELTEETADRLVSQLRDFLDFYRDQCERYGVAVPDADVISEPATPSADRSSA
jgi:hypothetical protein